MMIGALLASGVLGILCGWFAGRWNPGIIERFYQQDEKQYQRFLAYRTLEHRRKDTSHEPPRPTT